jgi:hypothetical protein
MRWQLGIMGNEISVLYDLLGTKYIRQNNLAKALENFQKVRPFYWDDYYSPWEKNGYGGNVFDANPFFDLKYTAEFIAEREDFRLNKASVTEKLMAYLAKANNPNEPNRAYYYFLVANGYYNMTQYGNSWMMRRYFYSNVYDDDNDFSEETFPEDEEEFRKALLSKKYYLLARQYAKSSPFAALCIRMTKDYELLKTEFPDDYTVLKEPFGCSYFKDYFERVGG